MVGVHATVRGPQFFGADLFDRFIEVHTLSHAFAQMIQMTSMAFQGVFEMFPLLKVAFLEAGCTWVPYWLGRMDEEWEKRGALEAPGCKRKPSEYLTQNEIDAASLVRNEELNTQQQMRVKWPDSTVVALAYVDQLTRSHAMPQERARAIKTALERADDLRSGQDKNASAVAGQLETIVTQLERDAGSASGRDAAHLRSLAATIKGRATRLKG